jgi:hypothetical protein
MTGLGDLLRSGCAYEMVRLSPRVNLHLISRQGFPSFSVLVSSGFGGCHRAWRNGDGTQGVLPEGTAHLTEHVLMFRNLHGELIPLERESIGRVNGLVDHARSVWWVKNAAYDEASPGSSIARAVERLLRVVSSPIPNLDLEPLVERARSDVKLEIAYRSQSELPLSTAVLASLFPSHPLGSSALGTAASLDEVELASQRAALGLLSSQLDSIVVLADRPIPDLAPMIEAAAIESGALEVAGDPPCPADLPAVGQLPLNRVSRRHPFGASTVAGGFAVEPLTAVCGDHRERAQLLLATELLRSYVHRPIGCVLTPDARVYLAKTDLPEPWLVDRDARLQILVQERLRAWQASFEVKTEMAVLGMRETPHALVKLCHLAACHGLSLEEMLDAANHLNAEHVDRMRVELDSPLRQAQVYFGPEELLDL